MDIVSRSAPVATVKGIWLFVFLCQRCLHISRRRTKKCHQPHPEHGACSSGRNSGNYANQIAHADSGGSGDDQGLERRKTVFRFLFLPERADHLWKIPDWQKAGPYGEKDACGNQQQDHQGDADGAISKGNGK